MGRLIAFILGGAALLLYVPPLFTGLEKITKWWQDTLGAEWYAKVFGHGPGIFAGIALLLLAVRGRD
jgi:hypothetical protein